MNTAGVVRENRSKIKIYIIQANIETLLKLIFKLCVIEYL